MAEQEKLKEMTLLSNSSFHDEGVCIVECLFQWASNVQYRFIGMTAVRPHDNLQVDKC